MIHVIGPKDPQPNVEVINTTSRSTSWGRGFSPFFLGPVDCYDGLQARNMENAWQYAKVYPIHVDANGEPTPDYFRWRDLGWEKKRADRYPAGIGAKPAFSWWEGKKLSYIEARYAIYIPLYAGAVIHTEAFSKAQELYRERGELWLWDFDGYDHRKAGKKTYKEVFADPNRKAGHGFVIAALLEGELKLKETV